MTWQNLQNLRPNHAIIVGCGRLGCNIATTLSQREYLVYILDVNVHAFDILPSDMLVSGRIVPVLGDGTLPEELRKVHAQNAHLFISVSGKDTINAMAAQLAKSIFRINTVICHMKDPVNKEMYSEFGLKCISDTSVLTSMILRAIPN